MMDIRIVTATLAVFGGVTFIVCTAYGLVVPDALHGNMVGFLEGILPGFYWLSFGSFLLGLAESVLFGVYAALLFVLVHNAFARRSRVEAA